MFKSWEALVLYGRYNAIMVNTEEYIADQKAKLLLHLSLKEPFLLWFHILITNEKLFLQSAIIFNIGQAVLGIIN